MVKASKRVRTPTVIQMEAVECGAASLAMVLAYYGCFVPLDRLRSECGVSRDGSKASAIVKVARQYGLTAVGFRKETEELKTLVFPLIVFWNFNHFVVVEGYDRKSWHINDPAIGPRKVDRQEFDDAYTGVVLTFSPGPEFKKGGRKFSILRALKRRSAGLWGPLAYAVMAGLVLTLLGLVIPAYSKIYIDNYLVGGMKDWVKPLLWAMGLTLILQVVITLLQQKVLLRLEVKLALTTSSRFLEYLLRLPMDFFSQRYAGELVSRVGLNNQVAQLLSGQIATNIIHGLMGIFFILIMFQYDVILTLVGISIAAVNLLALKIVSAKRKDLNKRLLQEQGKLMGVSMAGLMSVETLKATGGEFDFFSTWAGHQAKTFNSEQEMAVYSQLLASLPTLLTTLSAMAVLGLGGLRVIEGFMTMGELIAFQALMISFTTPFNNLVALGSQLQEAEGSLQRLDDVLDNSVDDLLAGSDDDRPDPDTPPKLSGRLDLRGVTFGYNRREKPLIENFDLSLRPGSRVALVGKSGSGKSTIARLVAGLLAPWEGEILFDGKHRVDIPRQVMTNSLALVDQDIMMFEGSIRENLTLWDETLEDDTVVRAAKDACIHDAVAGRVGGYQNRVEEGGRNFSGGERQRLEIARALAFNPTIILLDEATSALDPLSEKRIDSYLRRRGITCLIVAHRLSTIRDCDEIIVLDRGKVAERGTHETMRNADGPYANLIREY